MKKRIFLSSPTMNGTELDYIHDAFHKNWIAPLGENVDRFENEVSEYVGSFYAAALSSGTAAIHLAIKLANIQANDIVFCSDFTFSATANPISYEKGKQVFIDSEMDSWNMDPRALKRAFEKYPNVKAVVLVHLYGSPAKIDEIRSICDEHNVPLIEDAAESLGASYKGQQTGTFGKYGIFSFNGNKIITTSGGGMLVSNEKQDIEKAKFWATQSREKELHYEHKEIGYNYRMSNIVAGIGRGQLNSLKKHIEKKKGIYETYMNAFKEIQTIHMNPYLEGSDPNFWLSCITVDITSNVTPKMIIDALAEQNIESRPLWKPMHLQPVFSDCDYIKVDDSISVSEDLYMRGLCLPSDIKNSNEDMDDIITIVKKCFGH